MIFNISAILKKMPDQNWYSYTRIKNLLMGLKGNSTKKQIQQLRKVIAQEATEVDKILSKLENE